MARSQPIELKLRQALRVFSHLGKLEIGGLADELELEHDPKWGVGQMGQIEPLRGTICTQEREDIRLNGRL
jgi:hypothetical protein